MTSAPVDETAELAQLAIELARSGGALALQRRQAGFAVSTKSSPTDVVTDADRAVERLVRDELAARRPADSVVGEEAGDDGRADAAVRWLIDPIDGTVNFMLGLPQWAVSVAAEQDGRVIAGCVYNPVSGELFHASRGGGAYLDGLRLTGPRPVPLAEAVLGTGFGYDQDRRARQGRVVGELLGRVGNLRRLGSAALDLCFLAAGRLDLYFEGPLGEWDYAAGLLIAEEAGAITSGLYGRPAGSACVAAGQRDNAADFFALLEAVGAGRE
ncbi:MAG TPA: inositol monophosphatase family protein [Jatrophihabitans sp.]|nr:inositol monophosphatase family protein [Jatrophihabitans sp.]